MKRNIPNGEQRWMRNRWGFQLMPEKKGKQTKPKGCGAFAAPAAWRALRSAAPLRTSQQQRCPAQAERTARSNTLLRDLL